MLITRGLGKVTGGSGTVKVPEYVHIEDPTFTPTLNNNVVVGSSELKPSITVETNKIQPIVDSNINLTTLNIDVVNLKPHIKGNL